MTLSETESQTKDQAQARPSKHRLDLSPLPYTYVAFEELGLHVGPPNWSRDCP